MAWTHALHGPLPSDVGQALGLCNPQRPLTHLAGSIEAKKLGISGLVGIKVLAGRLAELLGRCGDVKNVIGNLHERMHERMGDESDELLSRAGWDFSSAK
eukprot:scaffold5681_cov30-Tisochrysis_lutea.AAC.4